jgi:hypothetical protein
MLVRSAAAVDLAQVPTAGANLDTMLLEHQGSQGICVVFVVGIAPAPQARSTGRLSGLASRHSDPIPAHASDETRGRVRMCGMLAELDRRLHV